MATGDKLVNLDALKAVHDADAAEVADLKSSLRSADLFTYGAPTNIIWTIGSLGSTGGYTSARKNNLRMNNAVKIMGGSALSCNSGYLIQVYKYSSDTTTEMQNAFLGRSDWTTNYVVTDDCYIRVLVGDTSHYNDSAYVLTDDSYKNQVIWDKFILTTIRNDVIALQDGVSEIQDFIPSTKNILNISDFTGGYYIDGSAANVGENWLDCRIENTGSIYTNQLIDVSANIGDTIVIKIPSNAAHSGARGSGFCNASGIITNVFAEKNLAFNTVDNALAAELIITDAYMFLSFSAKSSIEIYLKSDGALYKKLSVGSTVFVAPSGDDSHAGTQAFPMATINGALSKGARRICMEPGVYKQRIDLTLAQYGELDIKSTTPTQKTILQAPDSVLVTTDSPVSGYSRVRSATISVTFGENNIWLFQDGVADISTLIADADRMPEQRGYAYRCADTVIAKCNADNLSEALTEIENDAKYKWYLDGTTLYFSCPNTVSVNTPICGSFNTKLFSNATRKVSIRMTGIDIKYMACNLDNTSDSCIADCRCANVFGDGCFTWDLAVNAKFVRCEATRAFTGTNGDGFNAHGDNTGDAFAKETTCTLIDCWSHDNRDDGYSDHERCEMTIIGGLFEYNGKGGVTPSFGSHCAAYNVMSRHNYNGFNSFGETSEAEGGKGTQLICYNCIALSNIHGDGQPNAGFRAQSAGNTMICINCKSVSNAYGYRASSGASMTLYDCGSLANTTVRDGDVSVHNTDVVI